MSTFQIWKLRFKEFKWASLRAQLVKNLPAMQETQVRFLGWEDPRDHPGISSSVVPFSSCPQSLPASGSFPMSQLFT